MPTAHCAEIKFMIPRVLFELSAEPMYPRRQQDRGWRIVKPLIFALAAIFGSTLATAATASPVTWTFVETSCQSGNNGCQGLQLPESLFPAVQLILPDITSSGSYSFESPVTETG